MLNYILFTLFLFIGASVIPQTTGSVLSTASGVASPNSTSGAAPDPLDIYLHKLRLSILGNSTAGTGAAGSVTPAPIFNDVVNASKGDTFWINKVLDPNDGRTLTEINSLTLNCEGPECPRSALLQQSSSSSSELRSNSNNNYPPRRFDHDFDSTYDDAVNQIDYESSEGPSSASGPSASRFYFKPLRPQEEKELSISDMKKDQTHTRTVRNSEESRSSEDLGLGHGVSRRGSNQVSKLGPLRIFKYLANKPEDESKSAASKAQNKTLDESRLLDRKNKEHVKGGQERTSHEEEPEDQNLGSESTTTERSLIPNSYFDLSPDEDKKLKKETSGINGSTSEDEEFRPRPSSPFRPKNSRDHQLNSAPSREALYGVKPPSRHLHPPPPGLTPVAIPAGHQHPHALLGQSPMSSVVTIPVAVRLALQYENNVQGNNNYQQLASDRNFNNNVPAAESPEEQSTFRLPNFQHPFAKNRKPQFDNKHGRRHPGPSGHNNRHRPRQPGPVPSVMPPPKPIPVPRPRPQIHGSPSGRTHAQPLRRPPPHHHHHHPQQQHHMQSQNIHGVAPTTYPPTSNVQYTYPKNAANIQDILTFFKTDENDGIPSHPSSNSKPGASSSLPSSSSSSGGFSSELRDGQNSILKDIQNFEKRPSMLASGKDVSGESKPIPVPSPRPFVLPLVDPEESLEDISVEPMKHKPGRTPGRYKEQGNNSKESSSRERKRQRSKSYTDDKRREKYDQEPKPSKYYDDDESDEGPRGNTRNKYESPDDRDEGPRNRHRVRENYRDRDSSRDITKEDDSKDEEDDYRSPAPRQRDRFKATSSPSRHSDRYNNNQNDYRKDESDERAPKRQETSQYSNNNYAHNGNDRNRDRDYGYRSHSTNANKQYVNPSSSKPFQSSSMPNRQYPKGQKNNRHQKHQQQKYQQQRHKQQKHQQQRHQHQKHQQQTQQTKNFQEGYRHRGVGNGERSQNQGRVPHQQSSQYQPSPTKVTTTSMDQAYHQQRNRPVGIPHPAYRPPTIQKHYHYYGVNSVGNRQPPQPPPQPPPLYSGNTLDRPTASSTRRPVRYNDINLSPEENILEIYTGPGLADVSTTPAHPFGGGGHTQARGVYPTDREKKARLQRMYMEYLQRQLEAQAEAQAASMLTTPRVITTTPKPKRPMRMKIHIYPNEKVQVVDESSNNQNQLYPSNSISPYTTTSSFIYNPAPMSNPSNNLHRSYGHFDPTQAGFSPGAHQSAFNLVPTQSMVSRNVHVGGGPRVPPTGTASIDKNKNLVLHLHVHRRNDDEVGDGKDQMEVAGSETVTSTTRPLTYEQIYETSNSKNIQADEDPSMYDTEQNVEANEEQTHGNLNGANPGAGAVGLKTSKSLSMEVPIHHDDIDGVLSTLLKLRN